MGSGSRGRVLIGTRGSALALWQASAARDAIRAAAPDVEVDVRVISTKGDRILDQPLEKIGDKGLFTKDLEAALISGEVDLCVHSMKDVPTELPRGCAICAMLVRADVRDVLVCGPRIAHARSLSEVPAGSRLGTGSLRRTAQLMALYPHVDPKPIRGNVDTRLEKAESPDFEGVILAAAGVQRMGADDRIACYLPADEMIPAVGQGAIGIEARKGDVRMSSILAGVNDLETEVCVNAERRVLAALEGGCQVPLGAYARIVGGRLVIDAAVFAPDGSSQVRVRVERDGGIGAAVDAANEAVAKLLDGGARSILEKIPKAGGAAWA